MNMFLNELSTENSSLILSLSSRI